MTMTSIVRWLLWLMLVFSPMTALAQSYMTTVTAQVKDANGTLYNSCRYNATLVNLSNSTLTLGGTALPDQFKQVTGTQCDANGNLSTKLVANTALIPNNSQWRFTICDNTGANCFNFQLAITGTTQDITTQVQAAAVILPISNTTLLSGNNNFTGNNTHSGSETFNGSETHNGNNAFTGSGNTFTILRGRVDASTFTGADMCASMNLARTYAVGLGLGYGEIDMTGFHGRQDVAVNCWASSPATGTSPKGFVELDRFAPDTKAVTSVTQNPTTSVYIDGGSPWVWPFATSADFTGTRGFMFMPSDTFDWATQKAVMTLGYSGGTTNPRGIWLHNMGVGCISPNGTYTSGSKGILNPYSQEITGGDGIFVYNCTEGIDIEWDAAFTGAQNSGPWRNINIQAPNVPATETAYIGVNYCGHTTGAKCKANKGIDGGTINGPIGATTGVGVSVNAGNFAVRNLTMEALNYGVDIGAVNQAFGVTIDNVTTEGHSDTRTTAIIHASAVNQTSFTALNISANASPYTDYLIKDEGADGQSICGVNTATGGRPCNGATQTMASLSLYSCSAQAGWGVSRKCFINGPTPVAYGGEVTATLNAGYTATIADCGKLIRMTPAANNVTFTLPATPPMASCTYTVESVNVTGFVTNIDSSGTAIDGSPTSTTPLAVPQGQTMLITTNGTTYHTSKSWMLASLSNCSSATSPATCSQAAAGSVALAAAATTLVVNTTAVTAKSQILITEDSSLGTKLGITCNTTAGRTYSVTARTAATSFVITSSAAPTTNPACLSYTVIN